MTDRPILFSGPMVRALLDGSKTQTRRILGPQPDEDGLRFNLDRQAWEDTDATMHDIRFAVGDRLYVREAWRTLHNVDCLPPRYLADDPSKITFEADPENRNPLWAFGKFRQGMHMPRWASRLTLLVTEVRVQRLQDISEEDAKAEGCSVGRDDEEIWVDATWNFKQLWDSINAGRKDKDGNLLPYAWDDNPWIVAVTFETHKVNIDQLGAA